MAVPGFENGFLTGILGCFGLKYTWLKRFVMYIYTLSWDKRDTARWQHKPRHRLITSCTLHWHPNIIHGRPLRYYGSSTRPTGPSSSRWEDFLSSSSGFGTNLGWVAGTSVGFQRALDLVRSGNFGEGKSCFFRNMHLQLLFAVFARCRETFRETFRKDIPGGSPDFNRTGHVDGKFFENSPCHAMGALWVINTYVSG